jgi:four helix bundle protein
LKSANETKYWLELLRDSKLAESNTINELLNEAGEIASMLGAGVIKLKKTLYFELFQEEY